MLDDVDMLGNGIYICSTIPVTVSFKRLLTFFLGRWRRINNNFFFFLGGGKGLEVISWEGAWLSDLGKGFRF